MKDLKLIFTVIISIMMVSSCANDSNSDNENINENDSVASPETNGYNLFNDSGCAACHLPDSKSVGPSINEIASAYSENKEGMITFLRGEGEAIVDPSQYAVMKVNLSITKEMDDKNLSDLVDYILSI